MHTTTYHTESLDDLSRQYALTTRERLDLYRAVLLIWEHTPDPDERNARILKLIADTEQREQAA